MYNDDDYEDNPQLEENFKVAQQEVQDEVNAKVAQINALVKEIEKLSEDSGIPVECYLDFGQQYVPNSITKWTEKKLNFDNVNVNLPSLTYGCGWKSSSDFC